MTPTKTRGRKPAPSSPSNSNSLAQSPYAQLFSGAKEKWLPLFRRLTAQLERIQGIEFKPSRDYILISASEVSFGVLWIGRDGIDVGLPIARGIGEKSPRLTASRRSPKKMNYRIPITDSSEIDEELLAWIRTARQRARTSRTRST